MLTVGLPVTGSILHGSLYNFNCVMKCFAPSKIFIFQQEVTGTQCITTIFVVVIRNTVVKQFLLKIVFTMYWDTLVKAMSAIFNIKIRFKKIFIIKCHSGKFTLWLLA